MPARITSDIFWVSSILELNTFILMQSLVDREFPAEIVVPVDGLEHTERHGGLPDNLEPAEEHLNRPVDESSSDVSVVTTHEKIYYEASENADKYILRGVRDIPSDEENVIEIVRPEKAASFGNCVRLPEYDNVKLEDKPSKPSLCVDCSTS